MPRQPRPDRLVRSLSIRSPSSLGVCLLRARVTRLGTHRMDCSSAPPRAAEEPGSSCSPPRSPTSLPPCSRQSCRCMQRLGSARQRTCPVLSCRRHGHSFSRSDLARHLRIDHVVAGLEKSGRIVAFCDLNARFCDQKTWCSRNFAPKTRRPGASLRPDEHSSRPDSENKN